MSTDAPAPLRFIVKKANTEMLGTVLNELPDGYVAEVRHQEGSNWVIVAERAPESLSVVADDLAEAIRLTEEYSQLPAMEGWTWFDAFRRYRASGGTVPWPGLNSSTPRIPEMGGCNVCGYPEGDQHPTEAGKHEFQGGV